MNRVIRIGVMGLILCGAVWATAGRTAEAQVPGWDCWCGSWYNYGYPQERNSIPFYALHPPVYYSYPVARPYGYTPWAYPAYVQTPASEEDGSKEIINPHVSPSNKAKPTATGRTTSDATPSDSIAAAAPAQDNSHVIINPYIGATVAERDAR